MATPPRDPLVVTGVEVVNESSLHVRRAADGNQESLGWIIRHLTPFLRAEARYRMGRPSINGMTEEDVVQCAWMPILGKLSELQPRDGRLTPVLMKALSTAVLHRIMRMRRDEAARGIVQCANGESDFEDAMAAIPDDRTGVVTAWIRKESNLDIMRAIEGLAPREREVLILRVVERLPFEAIAESLGINAGNLRSIKHRALKKLRDVLPPDLLDDLREDETN